MNPIEIDQCGRKSWCVQPGDLYTVTGVTTNNKRFKIETSSYEHAAGINLWRGTLWLVRNGKRYVIRQVFN
jgi:hypothetical protein